MYVFTNLPGLKLLFYRGFCKWKLVGWDEYCCGHRPQTRASGELNYGLVTNFETSNPFIINHILKEISNKPPGIDKRTPILYPNSSKMVPDKKMK